jgi:hypothetical protein
MNNKDFDKDLEKDFDKFINVNIYINGIFLIDSEEDKILQLNINISKFENYQNEKCEVFRLFLEEKVKKYVIKKIKENCNNTIELSRNKKIPVKNILYSYFINNRIDNIDIIWSPSALKEFDYVPINHYIKYQEDILFLKIKKLKFKKKFI